MSDLGKKIANTISAANNNNKDDWLYNEFKKKPKVVEKKERADQSIKDAKVVAKVNKKIDDDNAANSLKIAIDKKEREAKAQARRIEQAKADAEKAAKRKGRSLMSNVVLLSQQAKIFENLCEDLNNIFRKEDELTLAIFRKLIKFIEDKVNSELHREKLELLHEVIKDICGDASNPTEVAEAEQARILATVKNLAATLNKDLSIISQEEDPSKRTSALQVAVEECLRGVHLNPHTRARNT